MLTLCYVTKWEKVGQDSRVLDATNGTQFLLNGNRINGLRTRATTKAQFLYHFRLNDPKEKAGYLETEQSVATIVTNTERTWNSNYILLNFYTDNDITKATFAQRVNVETIALIWQDSVYEATKSWVMWQEGGKLITALCSYSIGQIYSLADDGNLTTS